ncbi:MULTISPECIES: DUF4395 domain-containing protein [Bacteria]|uniref:DUF4395 domain-containing protein n=1 Tax=Bacteria TaxID=2 RepID=UPI003C7AFF4E
MSAPAGIDPRGPVFAARITAALLLLATVLGLVTGPLSVEASSSSWFASQPRAVKVFAPDASWTAMLTARVLDPAFLLTLAIALLFLWGVLSPRTQPWSVLFRRMVRPRLAPPVEVEDPRPPRFAQGVGLIVVTVGLVLHLIGVPWALPIATAAAFVAAFLNAVFGVCLGCQLYLLLQRAGIVGQAGSSAAA